MSFGTIAGNLKIKSIECRQKARPFTADYQYVVEDIVYKEINKRTKILTTESIFLCEEGGSMRKCQDTCDGMKKGRSFVWPKFAQAIDLPKKKKQPKMDKCQTLKFVSLFRKKKKFYFCYRK